VNSLSEKYFEKTGNSVVVRAAGNIRSLIMKSAGIV
jgi:hypothetical protein